MTCKANATKDYLIAVTTIGAKDILLNEGNVGSIVARMNIDS
jgi:hypothetical protein